MVTEAVNNTGQFFRAPGCPNGVRIASGGFIPSMRHCRLPGMPLNGSGNLFELDMPAFPMVDTLRNEQGHGYGWRA